MKKVLVLAACALLTGCSSPLGKLGRVWPDGASVAIDEINLQVSMTGSGSMVIRGARWVGTNGFPITTDSTNSLTSTSITTRSHR